LIFTQDERRIFVQSGYSTLTDCIHHGKMGDTGWGFLDLQYAHVIYMPPPAVAAADAVQYRITLDSKRNFGSILESSLHRIDIIFSHYSCS